MKSELRFKLQASSFKLQGIRNQELATRNPVPSNNQQLTTNNSNFPIGGIILAGGQSRRMGTNKALLRLEPDGPTIIEKVVAALQEVTSEILLVTNQPQIYEWLDLPMVGDNYQVGASLAGLEAGLSASKYEHNLVVACDMPYLNPELLRYLLNYVEQYAAIVPVGPDEQLETLCAVYSRQCLTAIRAKLAQGQYKMAGWLDEVNSYRVPTEELEKCEPDLRSFVNLNTPAELEHFKHF